MYWLPDCGEAHDDDRDEDEENILPVDADRVGVYDEVALAVAEAQPAEMRLQAA